MLWSIIGILLFMYLLYLGFKDDNKDVAAWRNGEYGLAILYMIWSLVKIILFMVFAPILLFFFLNKD
jgi:hypothetical protein